MPFKPISVVRPSAVIFISLSLLLPLFVLFVAGLLYVWRMDFFLPALAGWLIITGLTYAYYRRWPAVLFRPYKAKEPGILDEEAAEKELNGIELSVSANWSSAEVALWRKTQVFIEQLLVDEPGWEEMPEHMLLVLTEVSEHYHHGSKQSVLKFTLPELLLVVSIVSDRYRGVLKQQVPFSDKITVAQVLMLYNKQPSLKKTYRNFDRVRRLFRLSNPMSAVFGELREHMANHVFEDISGSMTKALQRLLLQEVAQVGIDLYSGLLKVSDAELSGYTSQAGQADLTRIASENEPVRVVFISQISAGKSSLVNAILQRAAAEVDPLPTTDNEVVYPYQLSEEQRLYLVDTPGIQGSKAELQQLVSIALDADVLVWVTRVNQSARAVDRALFVALNEAVRNQPLRKMPPMVLVATHKDMLPPDKIDEALDSIRSTIGLPNAIRVISVSALVRHEQNIEGLIAELGLLYDLGLQNQMNRRRIELITQNVSWKDRLRQINSLGKSVRKPLGHSMRRALKATPIDKWRGSAKDNPSDGNKLDSDKDS